MIPEIGNVALILSLFLAVSLSLLPMLGSYTGQTRLMLSAKPLSVGLGVMLLIAFAMLTVAFAQDDFSVRYVAQNSNTALPIQYKISAVWGGHEGSLLLWVVILGMWTMAVSLLSKTLPLIMQARVLAVMGMIGVGFISFTLLTSNPFWRLLPEAALQGADLNPLLQDFGLIVHPPMLYMGYVGFSVAFAFAIAALLDGHYDAAWVRWSRPWTSVAWAFLTAGIALGSWWAYYELGWGGWWFWDPVENASFMPWLVGTALLHSLAVSEKRGLFKNWTLLLAILAFSLSLLGTFLVRSGVLTSVHAFASDPDRGYFVLVLLAITVGGSLLLFALRATTVESQVGYRFWSRETFLLSNNVLLVIAALTILLGTLYPLFLDALGGGKISVGPPYFNAAFVPLMVLLVVAMGFGLGSKWKRINPTELLRLLRSPALIAVVLGLAFPFTYAGEFNASTALAAALLVWLLAASWVDLSRRLRHQNWWRGLRQLNPGYYGMLMAHLGVGVMALGIAVVSHYSVQKDLRMGVGDQATLGQYEFTFMGVKNVVGPNFTAVEGQVKVVKDSDFVAYLLPQKRTYTSRGQVMTEASIDPALSRDIYVAMGEPLSDGAWAMRLHIKPLIRWIWLGALMMALGGMLAVWDKRYRRTKSTTNGAVI
ncbi:heme lyase CcmF/NrfE family subunit [Oceanospirillaceae bacterium]|jgi:cytochrome c-type biogenesis protein CcmF|nr:heme lyase CcmF/NrfE family subunit [Oceanospirillaceae bacterium]MBT6100977.1 heme lyase CcmF/NrfE family subunit [Oceanospirillaceae bacterium]MBT7674749.1 heme lyase CcmF/NrfE family subunit [Oceanospirillaceae bacterium]MDC1506273.1 heme lyase CcmF/NrfE family subunit [Oceanospirillaceae bacterium]MDO7573414.1 heme lyase CcmF/NrfE family subunit [Oceanospirillaceae bacterium]